MVIEKISSRVSPIVAVAVAAVIMAGAVVIDFLTPAYFNPAIFYIPTLVMVALARKKRLVWGAMVLAIVLTLAGIMWGINPEASLGENGRLYLALNRTMVIFSLLATAVVAIAHLANVSWLWIALDAAALHILIALIFLLIALNRIKRPIFRETSVELKKDREWLKSLEANNQRRS